MKNRIFFLLLWTFLLFGCSKNPDTPLPTDPPEEVINNKYAITSEGGTINDKGSGVKIEIPKGATEKTLNFTITKSPHNNTNLNFLGNNIYPSASDVYNIEYESFDNLLIPAKVEIPYNSIVTNPKQLGAAYFSEELQKWISVDIDSIDAVNKRIIFKTIHFSLWTSFKDIIGTLNTDPSEFKDSIDTEFRPNIDGFPFPNDLFYPFHEVKGNLITGSGIGNCAGFSALAIRYFSDQKNKIKQSLYSYSFRDADYISKKYYDVYHGINIASNTVNGYFIYTLDVWRLRYKSINNTSLAYDIYKKLALQNQPIFLGISDKDKKKQHAVVVYKYKKMDDGTGLFYYYDNNLKGVECYFKHNQNGSIEPFIYATFPNGEVLITEHLAPSTDGGLTPKKAKEIFDKYFVPPTNLTPALYTSPISDTTQTTAISGGKIIHDGGATVTAGGVCWSTSKNPTIDNNKTSDGTGTGEFTSKITNLTPNTTYYVRAYATNINGTAYGSEISFITQKNIDLPLKLSVSSLSLNVNATENIEVTSGNGSYTVVSSDANIATATISGSIITIKGITEGNTTVAVTDTQSKETATVAVTVNKVDVPPPTDRPKMAIEYFAEYNINKDGTGFVTDHNSDDMGFFNWYEAAGIQDSIYNKDGRNLFAPTGLLKDWRLPTGEEWLGLTGNFSGLTFGYSIHEAVTVGGVDKTYISDYFKSRGALTTFALRFKQAASERAPGFPPATDNSMLSAYRYDYVLNSENNKSKFYFKITVRYLGNDFTGNIYTINKDLFWQTNNSDDIIFILPTRGYLLPDNTTTVDSRLPIGYYWSNKHTNDERENAAIFGEQICGPVIYAHKYLKYSIRPIKK